MQRLRPETPPTILAMLNAFREGNSQHQQRLALAARIIETSTFPNPWSLSLASFGERLRIFDTRDAKTYAAGLFRESFRAPFPEPRVDAGLSIATPPSLWRQYVALYAWPEGREETVGFCNWIRHGDVYLEGGLCVSRSFYRRLPREDFLECKAAGGIAQLMMEQGSRELGDCKAWFGYCGDAKSLAVCLRAGYVPTSHKHLIVKWFAKLPESEQRELVSAIARIGPF